MGLVTFLFKFFIFIFCIALLLIFLPGIPPHVNFSYFEVDECRPYEGALSRNNILDNGERLFEGHLHGPESVASRSPDEIFVGVHGGDIIKIWGKNFENSKVITKIGPGCVGLWEEHICGRPLGLRFGNDGKLLVADSYLGIFSVDVDTGKKERLVDASKAIDGVFPLLVDDLDVDSAGNIYWSDASTVSSLANGAIEMQSDPSGRLLKYDPRTKKNTVLLSNIHFANGVQLSKEHSFVLVSESFRHRVLRYWLKGPKAGKSDVFVSGLPGIPDNIRARKPSGYYVSLVANRDPAFTDIFSITSRLPHLRKLLIRSSYLLKSVFDAINRYYPNEFSSKASYKIFNLGFICSLMDRNASVVVEVSEEGKITGSLQGYSGRINCVSQTNHVGNNLFFGSPFNNYLGRLQLGTSFETPKEEPKKKRKSSKDEL